MRPHARSVAASRGSAYRKRTASAFFTALRGRIESLGVLTEASGIAGNNANAVLPADGFSGFAAIDDYAPLVFVNTNAAMEARTFELMREFAHVLRGEPGISGGEAGGDDRCSRFALEILLPSDDLPRAVTSIEDAEAIAQSHFVDCKAVLLSARRHGAIDEAQFGRLWEEASKHPEAEGKASRSRAAKAI